jgi:hypothetical protein
VNRLFDAVVMSARPESAPRQADPLPVIPQQLKVIWAALKLEQARGVQGAA